MANYKKERVWTPHDVNDPNKGGYYKTVVTEVPSSSKKKTKGLDPNFTKKKSGDINPMIINMAKGIDEAFRKTGIFGKHFTAEAINERRQNRLMKKQDRHLAKQAKHEQAAIETTERLEKGDYKMKKKREGRMKGNFLFPLGGEKYTAGK